MERAIDIRSIDGESVTVSIAPDRSVVDLKVMLKESFPPAMASPNFHLYFRGAKLSSESHIDSLSIENGDFIVLVPFAKKTRQVPPLHDPTEQNNVSSHRSYGSATASAADSAWRDMMDDVSYLSSISKHDVAPNNFSSSNNPRHGKCEASIGESSKKSPFSKNHKRESNSDLVVLDILCSGSTNVFDEQTSDKIRQVVESVNCLSYSDMGSCLLFEGFYRKSHESDQCVCPPWLKRVLKTFTFLNIFYAFLQVQDKCMTRNYVEEALKQPSGFGLDDVCISDVEKLPILCPKVVVFLGKEETTVGKLGSAILISTSTEVGCRCGSTNKRRTARKQVPTSAIMNAIKNRGFSFRNNLWKAIKCSMEKTLLETSIPPVLSLEDLIMSINNGTALPKGSQVKSMKTRSLAPRCHGVNQLEPTEMVEHLRGGIGTCGQIVHVEEIFAKLAVHVELPNGLSETSKAATIGMGISRLYSHQAEAIQASLSGKNVAVATSTSSGKSLCYNLPVLEALSQNPSSCALYMFPTKALAQDQLRALLEMTKGFDICLNVGVYDGDTSQGHRSWIRDDARVLITNPDMLHMSILPYHRQFQRILSNLRFIVIDEAHTYKGALGCHTAFVLRRLRRICFHVYGTDPSFIFSTATSANPREHAMELANLQTLELIQNDGSPCGPKYFLLWNPPLRSESKTNKRKEHISVNGDLSTRRSSSIMEASYLFAEMVQHGLRCITFCKTRKLTELVLYHTREILQGTAPNLVDSICVYRGGYTPQDRRRIETDLFGGKLRGVAATNALELGIDVGHIDATLHLGFPGSVASLWQQAGRSGRRSRPSLAIYVAFEGPLDQYFMKFPHKLFQRPIELCQVDAQNQKVLQQHITCAALELPLCPEYDEKYFGSGLHSAIDALKNTGYLGSDPLGVSSTKIWSYIGPEERPSHAVSIRAIENDKYKVVDQSSSEVLEEIEESRAFFQVYEGAVYMNQGITYLVKALILAEKTAFCEKADLKYYTKTRDYTDIHVIGGDLAYPPVKPSQEYLRTTAQTNTCKVTTNWFGFYRIWRSNNQIFDRVELVLPAYSYESQATWIRVPQSIKTALEMQEFSFRAGLHAACHALLNVVPLYIMCNASDLSTECANPHETRDFPERLLLYDKHPGGIGISAKIQLLFTELLTAATELVSTCSCSTDAGCPNCVQILTCSEYNEVLDKNAAIVILKGLIESEISYFESRKECSSTSGAD